MYLPINIAEFQSTVFDGSTPFHSRLLWSVFFLFFDLSFLWGVRLYAEFSQHLDNAVSVPSLYINVVNDFSNVTVALYFNAVLSQI